MRRISIFATALILIGVGAWTTTKTTSRVDVSTADAVYPLQLTVAVAFFGPPAAMVCVGVGC
jgi:hypothetical protein